MIHVALNRFLRYYAAIVLQPPKESQHMERTELTMQNQQTIPAGDFSAWLRQVRNSLQGTRGIEVACGDCIGCCSSSYFIHIKPQEKAALSRVPEEVLFPAPGMPNGHVLMGYDKAGLCPMLKNRRCAIYDHRPQTCRNYDCRIFAAAGIAAGSTDKDVINERVNRWQFNYPTELDRKEHQAVRAVAAFVRDHASSFPAGRVPDNPSQLAVIALKSYDVFLNRDDNRTPAESAKAIVEACRQFDLASKMV